MTACKKYVHSCQLGHSIIFDRVCYLVQPAPVTVSRDTHHRVRYYPATTRPRWILPLPLALDSQTVNLFCWYNYYPLLMNKRNVDHNYVRSPLRGPLCEGGRHEEEEDEDVSSWEGRGRMKAGGGGRAAHTSLISSEGFFLPGAETKMRAISASSGTLAHACDSTSTCFSCPRASVIRASVSVSLSLLLSHSLCLSVAFSGSVGTPPVMTPPPSFPCPVRTQ